MTAACSMKPVTAAATRRDTGETPAWFRCVSRVVIGNSRRQRVQSMDYAVASGTAGVDGRWGNGPDTHGVALGPAVAASCRRGSHDGRDSLQCPGSARVEGPAHDRDSSLADGI